MILTFLMVVHIVILLNLNFTAWPEIFSFPYLFNNGFNLYKDMVHPYTPLLTVFLSNLYNFFGYNVWIVKFFTYTLILINDLLIFKIVSKITKNSKYGLYAVLFYLLTQPFLDGNQLWFDFAMSTPILVGSLLILNKKYFLSGVAFAIAFLTKQNSALFFVPALIYAFKDKRVFKFLLGALLPVVPFAIYLYLGNSVVDFFNWTLIYPSTYWTSFPNYLQMIPNNRQLFILLILFVPTIYLLLKSKFRNNLLLYGSLIISLILIYPRFSLFHFQVGLAFLAITFGVAISYIKNKNYFLPSGTTLLFLIIIFLLIPKDWGRSTRFIDDHELSINKLLITQTEKIYLLGPHSLNYVTSGTLPPKPWIDNYGWYFEMPNMQQKMIDGWKVDPPQYIYWSIPQKGNWYDLGTYQPKEVVKYIKENYQKVDQQEDVEIWKLQ